MYARRPLVSPPGGIGGELLCEEDRLAGSVRITVTVLLMVCVMLAYQMPFLSVGPYLVFILSQRDTLLTRASAVLAVVVGAAACLLVWLIVLLAWDIAWLRFTMLVVIFYAGYYFMRVLAKPAIVLGALVVLALFSSDFDTFPFPNKLLDQLGWLWAVFGLLFVATFMVQWLLRAPTALELLRVQMRRILVTAEAVCIEIAAGRPPGVALLARERGEAAARIHLLGATKTLLPAQVARCEAVLEGCSALLSAAPQTILSDAEERSRLRSAAGWLRKLRRRVLLGAEEKYAPPADPPRTPALQNAFEELARAGAALTHEAEFPTKSRAKPPLLPADWITNPQHASFALRATLATMGCYVFMTLTDWGDIHTCMITCVVTALALAEDRARKQTLRIVGATIGGALGIGAVVFFIPRFDSLMALLLVLAVGTMFAAWVTLGSKRISYAGWQIALAFYMTILQDPHPTTKIDVIRDRWVGILVGILAMRAVFALPMLQELAAGPRRMIPEDMQSPARSKT